MLGSSSSTNVFEYWWKKNKSKPLSLCRPLGLPPSATHTPCRIWKPPGNQLHRAPKRADSPPTRPPTTRHHTVRCREPSGPRNACTCATATGEFRRESTQGSHRQTSASMSQCRLKYLATGWRKWNHVVSMFSTLLVQTCKLLVELLN